MRCKCKLQKTIRWAVSLARVNTLLRLGSFAVCGLKFLQVNYKNLPVHGELVVRLAIGGLLLMGWGGTAIAAEPAACTPATPVTVECVQRLPNYSFKLSVATDASKATIWRLWTDVENWKTYDTILQYSHLIDGADFVVGAEGYVKAKGAPKTKFELIEVQAPTGFVERLKIPLYQAIELRRYFEEDADGRTVFTHEVNFRGSLRWLTHALLGNNFRHETVRVMTRLRDLAETQEADSDAS